MKGFFVWFEFQGTAYHGYLEAVCGAGSKVYHLMVDRFYWGRLRQLAAGGWAFDGNRKGLEILANHFGFWVTTTTNLRLESGY